MNWLQPSSIAGILLSLGYVTLYVVPNRVPGENGAVERMSKDERRMPERCLMGIVARTAY
ncbi:hypothetical protein ABZ379_33050 [Streptomyces canus]|uniref:hypothetical protein n=1 Tax=Streptomyces canus TaxID=58343 RepID=UPI0033D72EE1